MNSVVAVLDIGQTYQLTAETLNEEWVAYSTRQGGCKLDQDTLDQWEGDLIKTTRKTPSSRRSVAKATPAKRPLYVEEMETLTEENLDEMYVFIWWPFGFAWFKVCIEAIKLVVIQGFIQCGGGLVRALCMTLCV